MKEVMITIEQLTDLTARQSVRIVELQAELEKLRVHIKTCLIYRMSALHCMCGLEKELTNGKD